MNQITHFWAGQRLRMVVVWAILVPANLLAADGVWRFDCGPAGSRVRDGYALLSDKDVFDASRGYGWIGDPPQGVEFGYPAAQRQRGGANWVHEFLDEYRNDLNRDGVTSSDDVAFQLALPNGAYRVSVTIGDLSKELGSIVVSMNGKKVEERVAAWAPGGYRALHKTPAGWWTDVRSTVRVTHGRLDISLTSDQSYYDEQMEEQKTWENPIGVHWRNDTTRKDPPYHFIGYPFVHHGIMAIEVTPDTPLPIVLVDSQLTVTRDLNSPILRDAISAYNSGDVGEAAAIVAMVSDPQALVGKAILQLHLAGRLDVELEEELIPAAVSTLQDHLSIHPHDHGVAELLHDAELFATGLRTHLNRGRMRWVDDVPVQRNHFIENDKAFAFFWMIKPGSPLYHKARLYAGQAAHMLMPYIPTLNTAKMIFEELHKDFPENRYVRFYLDYEWDPHGDGSGRTDWYLHDYYSETEGSPEWARLLQSNYAQMIDWAEYWIRHKQYPEGNIGGGYGDDVEIVGAFGYLGFLSKGVSDGLVAGTGQLVEGMWHHSAVDPELGFCLPITDAEHSAESTGNTLGMMVQIDYGNPLWIERSLKTAKLIRDLWTAKNNNGQRQFRANFFGAAQVGTGDQANDSWINYRAVRPAAAVLNYNRNPQISRLFTELADAWLAAAFATERGKPRGVIPSQMSFPEALIGGTNSPNWWTASHPARTVNYDWFGRKGQSYKGYIQNLLMTAFQQTGDAKYLEPMRLEYMLADKYGYAADLRGRERLGQPPWTKPMNDTRSGIDILLQRWTPPRREVTQTVRPRNSNAAADRKSKDADPGFTAGSEQWVANNLKATEQWLKAERILEGRKDVLVNDITKQQIEDQMLFGQALRNMVWPLMTTQASATDRVPIPGLLPVLFTYSGGGFGGAMIRVPITYVDTTKYFAAAVMATDPQGFRLLYHSMAPADRDIGIVPWELEPNGEYMLTWGPDSDDDEIMDSVTERRFFVWPQAGTPIRITVKPQTTYLVELTQTKRGRVASMAADVAISAADLRYNPERNLLLARVHNVGSLPVQNVDVVFYEVDPEQGAREIGRSTVPNIEAQHDLDPRHVTVGVNWTLPKEGREVFVVLDPHKHIEHEITTFNNSARKKLTWTKPKTSWAEI